MNVEDVLELLAIPLVGVIPEDETVVVSTNRGQPVAIEGKSRAGQAFNNIAHRLNDEDVPFLNLDEKNDLFSRLSKMIKQGGG